MKLTGSALADALIRPRVVALVGVSDDLSKTASRPLAFMRSAGYSGAIYCVNPSRDSIQGETSYKSLGDLPELPEHVFILTNSELALDVVAECGSLGIKLVTILAGGFSESGAEGVDREARLKELGQRLGVRILGPSSIGVVNVGEHLTLTANAAFAESGLKAGGIFCASHSGSLIGAMISRGATRGLDFHSLVSVGAEVDLSIGEICAATLDDPSISGYLLFLESMRHADQLRDFAIAAAERGKPVAAYKLGRSEVAAELAVSHTGALAGEDIVADTFLRDCGIARVETFEGLLEIAPLLKRIPHMQSRPLAVGVLTTTGGGAAMAVDQLGIRDVDVVAPSPETLRRLAERKIDVSAGSIIDLTLAGTRYSVMSDALDVLMGAPEFDLILAVVGSSARTQPELAVKPIIDARHGSNPLACFVVPEAPEALTLLGGAGVPSFRTPESCADAIAALAQRRSPVPLSAPLRVPSGKVRTLTELEAYDLLGKVGIASAPSLALTIGAPIPELPFEFPVVVKVLHGDIAHKTEVGGVVLNVRNEAEIHRAINSISNSVTIKLPQVQIEQVLVQAQTQGVGEVLIGLRRDPDVGYLIMLAAGGILTEIYRDRSMRLAPVTIDTAREMISEVKGLQALAGFRGRPRGDLEAVAQALVSLSRLASLSNGLIDEAEVNPLIVMPEGEGVLAVDGLISVFT
ncbi:acetate--CoA ligase family protein [Pseudomonas gingeri]|uniref:acetate--CoA ligase family protein n=1 Tax=Pseudomonas gingeri TaxID=117681 RepID=UPI0015A29BC6|nr:acetate--CoA ligase family protein [Pseudomonas gingeri]NWD66898.1 acetate--CoA ligase family protein [Pseudomonas gingeri]